ncbi:hypothetical protein QNA08_07935 [Chelatococcus sp. SYSU_G07232]|uniref:Uncharacterized protein n=1 Tax=Chelatococcus albus TaxID=3047466 RepID=A0ABT7AFK9_9HYPH|nr:hypothetical protein [Chelatococcus sp. SYSU_G07232]
MLTASLMHVTRIPRATPLQITRFLDAFCSFELHPMHCRFWDARLHGR